MKQILTLVLTLALLMSCAACSAPNTSTNPPKATDPTQSTEPAPADPTPPPVSFETQTVVDNEYCTIQITGIDPDNLWGYTLDLYLENKSPDTEYMFALSFSSVNGLSMNALFATEVSPGMKANQQLHFTNKDLAALVGTFTDIELTFQVTDANDWLAKPVANPTIHIYPYGEDQATVYHRPAAETDTLVLDIDALTVIVTEYTIDPFWGYCAKLFLVNKTDKTLMFSADDVSVNSFMLDPFYAEVVEGGKCAYSFIAWSESDLEDNGITKVETIELTLRVTDAADWTAEDVVNMKIELNP